LYLTNWAEALQRNDTAGATRWLAIARNIGDAVAALSGEALLRDAVRTIDGASPADRRTIAAAHILYYRNGRVAYSHDQREAAERAFLQSAEAFEALHDPMALRARHYAAIARLA